MVRVIPPLTCVTVCSMLAACGPGVGSGAGPSGSGGSASGGATGSGGVSASGGTSGSGGRAVPGTGGTDAGPGDVPGTAGDVPPGDVPGTDVGGDRPGDLAISTSRFSFFVTSLLAMRALSGSQDGFGGDLRFGETTGLAGADKICRTIAERGMPGAGTKTWRAFLSATTGGPTGGAVNAIDRIGDGPWYDRMGRLVAMTRVDLQQARPRGTPMLGADLSNEDGVPNHMNVDNHDTLTGSNAMGLLNAANRGATCNDWTSAVGTTGRPMLGHSWPAASGMGWIQAHAAAGCAPGVNLIQMGGPPQGATGVGSGGGYGGIYCFALTP